jgi:F-type H+-transporting ATPase subunit b
MPQLDPSSFFSQIFWLVISFSVLYFFVASFLVPKITKIFKERESRISSALQSAEQARNEAVKIESDYKSKLAYTRKTTALNIAEALNEITKNSKKQMEETEKELKIKLQNSEKELAKFRISAREEIRQVIVQTVQLAAKKFIGIEASTNKIESLIRENIIK